MAENTYTKITVTGFEGYLPYYDENGEPIDPDPAEIIEHCDERDVTLSDDESTLSIEFNSRYEPEEVDGWAENYAERHPSAVVRVHQEFSGYDDAPSVRDVIYGPGDGFVELGSQQVPGDFDRLLRELHAAVHASDGSIEDDVPIADVAGRLVESFEKAGLL